MHDDIYRYICEAMGEFYEANPKLEPRMGSWDMRCKVQATGGYLTDFDPDANSVQQGTAARIDTHQLTKAELWRYHELPFGDEELDGRLDGVQE